MQREWTGPLHLSLVDNNHSRSCVAIQCAFSVRVFIEFCATLTPAFFSPLFGANRLPWARTGLLVFLRKSLHALLLFIFHFRENLESRSVLLPFSLQAGNWKQQSFINHRLSRVVVVTFKVNCVTSYEVDITSLSRFTFLKGPVTVANSEFIFCASF